MLRSYVYRSLISHALHHFIGIIILAIYFYVLVKDKSLLGVRDQHDILHSTDEALSFLAFFLILLLLITQVHKGYLLYIPSTYLSFDSSGISFKRFGKENRFVKWDDIDSIDLDVEGEWLLTMLIKEKKGSIISARLSELWLLSISKKLCVNHNFLKLIAIANRNSFLMSKLDQEQIAYLNRQSGVEVS